MPGEPTILHSSRTKAAWLLLGCLVFSVGGYFMYRDPSADEVQRVVAILGMAFFGMLGIPISMWGMVVRRKVIFLDEKGITLPNRRKKSLFLPWDQVAGFVERQHQIVVLLRDPTAYIDQFEGVAERKSLWLTMQLNGSPFSLPSVGLEMSCSETIKVLEIAWGEWVLRTVRPMMKADAAQGAASGGAGDSGD